MAYYQTGGNCGYKPSKAGSDQFGGDWDVDEDYDELYEADQLGGGCGFYPDQSRCYANKSDVYDAQCTKTVGKKGNLGCKRAAGVPKASESYIAKLVEKRKATQAFNAKRTAAGQKKVYGKKAKSYMEGDALPVSTRRASIAEAIEDMFGGGCTYKKGRCSRSKTEDDPIMCNPAKGPKGNASCRVNKTVPRPMSFGLYTDESKAKAARTRALNLQRKAQGLAPVRGKKAAAIHTAVEDMSGGGCAVTNNRCYANKSAIFDPNCIRSIGKKGRPGCKKGPGLTGKAVYTDESKQKAMATRALNEFRKAKKLPALRGNKAILERERIRTIASEGDEQFGGYWY